MLWIFIGGLMSINLLAKNGKIKSVDYSRLFPVATPYENIIKQKKIMILGTNWNLYRENTLGGIFLNWELSRPIVEDLTKYENIEIVASSFNLELPEVIVDENNYMEGIMNRIPAVKPLYKREGNLYLKINN